MHIWDRIRLVKDSGADFKTLFYSKPYVGMYLFEKINDDFAFHFHLSLASVPNVIIATAITNSSSTSLSTVFIFSARNFQSGACGMKNRRRKSTPRKSGTENRRQKMQSIYGAGFWSVRKWTRD